MIYINTLKIQTILNQKNWKNRMTTVDYRALTPLIYNHINPYGEFKIDMNTRITL